MVTFWLLFSLQYSVLSRPYTSAILALITVGELLPINFPRRPTAAAFVRSGYSAGDPDPIESRELEVKRTIVGLAAQLTPD